MTNHLVSVLAKTLKDDLKRRYVISGLSVYVLELAIIAVMQHSGYSSVLAVGISFWVGLIVSFVIHKLFTFKDKRVHHRILLPQVLAFSLLVIFNFIFTITLVKIFEHTLPAVVVRSIALAITTVWNLYLYKRRVFKNLIASDIMY